MADNVPITAGSGTNIATDAVGSPEVHYQKIKITHGADDTADNAVLGAGLPVDAGDNFIVQVAPTVTAGAYTADDCIGGEMTVANAGRVSGAGGTLVGITMASKGTVAAYDVEVLIFDADPAGTYTDNTALAVTAADAFLLLDAVLLDKLTDLGTPTMLTARNLNIPYVCDGTANLFAVAVNRGAFTPASTSDLQFTFHLIRD
jgi:hypothetical protein